METIPAAKPAIAWKILFAAFIVPVLIISAYLLVLEYYSWSRSGASDLATKAAGYGFFVCAAAVAIGVALAIVAIMVGKAEERERIKRKEMLAASTTRFLP